MFRDFYQRLPDNFPDATTLMLVVVALCVVGFLTHTGPGLANDTSRLAAAQAIVEHGTLSIDQTYFSYTVDKIKVGGEFYSDKPPLFSVYLAGLYALLTGLTGWTMSSELPSIYWWLSMGSTGLAFAAALVGVRRLARRLGAPDGWAVGTAVAACGGTLMLPYSVVISSHAVGAALLVWFAVFLFDAVAPVGESEAEAATSPGMSPTRAIGTGGIGGLATLVEPLCAVFVVPMTLAFSWGERQRSLFKWLVLGGVIPLIPHAIITWQIAGNPFLANVNPEVFDYDGSMHHDENLSGTGWSHGSLGAFLSYSYHSLVGYRGFVIYNPPAALGLVALATGVGRSQRGRLLWGVLVGVLLFFLLTLGFTENYSGWAYGIRWHATPAPLLAACLGGWLGASNSQLPRIGRAALPVFALAGGLLALHGTKDPWTPSTHREHSFVEVSSGEPAYVKSNLDAAVGRFRAEHYAEARHQAEHVLRRSSTVPIAWEIAIVSSARLGDRDQLLAYREALRDGDWSEQKRARRLLLERLERALGAVDGD